VISKLSLGLVGLTVLAGILLGSGDIEYRGFGIVLLLDDGIILTTCVFSELTARFLELSHESTHWVVRQYSRMSSPSSHTENIIDDPLRLFLGDCHLDMEHSWKAKRE
jgi:hypothetical protein